MKKTITIEEKESGAVPITIDDILEDIKRIYERDSTDEKDNKDN